jgi:signal transduction histidine kinase
MHRGQRPHRTHRGFGRFGLGRMSDAAIILSADPRTPDVLYAGRVPSGLISTMLAQPGVADRPRRVWRDWVLIGVLVPTALIEGFVRDDVVWSPVSVLLVASLVTTLLWRRQYPLVMTAITMGSFIVLDQVSRLVGGSPVEIYTSAFLLIHVYALYRWGSGRECTLGLGIMAAAFTSSLIVSWSGFGDAIGGAIVVLFPALLGIEVRHLLESRVRNREEVKVRERELLARELHDTVAHHVSAIAVQAQAGRVVGVKHPEAALEALAVIEEEASRTLAEMRSIVATLRGAGDERPAIELSPQPGVADIERLGARNENDVHIEVQLPDDTSRISPTVGAAIYRVTQEAITNVRRHARNATLINIDVSASEHEVALTVDDDGRSPTANFDSGGFGLVGMAERAQLLGGTFEAGPGPSRGWRVHAVIPLRGGAS